jgi:hypothetical protein
MCARCGLARLVLLACAPWPSCAQTKDKVQISYRPVHMKPLSEEMPFIPPKARVY